MVQQCYFFVDAVFKKKKLHLRVKDKGLPMPLLVYNGISVSLLTRHCAVFLGQCHGKCVNDLVLEMRRRFFPPCLYKLRLLVMSYTVVCLCA